MRIVTHKDSAGKVNGYTLWLSANDTREWARRPGESWPCSELSGRRAVIGVDRNGLCDMTINGRSGGDCDGIELVAIVSDHIPATCAHLWPTWAREFPTMESVPGDICTRHGRAGAVRILVAGSLKWVWLDYNNLLSFETTRP